MMMMINYSKKGDTKEEKNNAHNITSRGATQDEKQGDKTKTKDDAGHEHTGTIDTEAVETQPREASDRIQKIKEKRIQQQAIRKMQNKAKTSKQMLFVLRALHKKLQGEVQTQLLLFEDMQLACPKEVSQIVNKDLRKETLNWAAVREEEHIKPNDTDKYICQWYEVLVNGKTKHEILGKPSEPVSATTIKENVKHIFKGKNDAMEIDQQYKQDDKKKATSPEIRRSELDYAYETGAKRMALTRPDLKKFLDDDVKEFLADGFENNR